MSVEIYRLRPLQRPELYGGLASALAYVSFSRHHHGELSCDIIVGDRTYRCVREIGGAEAACFMGYDVTRAKLSQAKCPLPLEICAIFQLSANNNRNSRHAAAARKILLSRFLFVKYMTIHSSNLVNFVRVENYVSLS